MQHSRGQCGEQAFRSRAARTALVSASFAGLLLGSSAAAQTGDEIIVHAARLPPAAGDKALSTVVIDEQKLQSSARLDAALTDTPGVQLFRRNSSAGANPTTQGISVRGIAGSGAGRALVTLDGAPQNDPFGGWVIWSALPPESLERATIVRGAGAGPYGAGALTGVISLDERVAVPGGFAASAAAGENGYGRIAAVGETDLGPTRLFFSAASENGGSWIPVRAGRGAADAALSLRDWSLATRASADIGRTTVSARVGAFDESRNSGLVGAESEARGVSASVAAAAAPTDKAPGWRMQAWWRHSNLHNTSVAVAAGRTTTTPANNQYDTPADGYGLNAAMRWASAQRSFELGADIRTTEGEDRELFRVISGTFTRNRIAGGKTLVGGVYGETSWTTGPWLLTGGVRVDSWRSTDAKRFETDRATGAVTLNSHAPDADGVVPTGRAAVRRDFGEGYFARAGAYAGFRPATLNELHRPFRVGNDVTEANPLLKPETLAGAEAGLGRQSGSTTWSANIFYNQLDDAITNVTIGGPGTYPIAGVIPAGGVLRQRQNAGSIEAYGLEAEVAQKISDRFGLHAAATLTHAEVDGGAVAPQLTGLRPAQTPRFTASAGVDWRIATKLNVALDMHYESQRWDDDQNIRALAPALTANARAEWALTDAARFFVAVDNITDVKVETAQTADGIESLAAPRRAMIGLAWRR
jgi:outer membrane receptor protein involved in Fe transport